MPQELNVLRCYSCLMFQVHIVKKLNKWQCKICNEKQSIKNVYYRGSGQDCRLQVQYLNFTEHTNCKKGKSSDSFVGTDGSAREKIIPSDTAETPAISNSKWTKYLNAYKEAYDQDISQNSHLKNEENSLRAGCIDDQEETNSSSSVINDINEISTDEIFHHENEGNFQVKNNFEDVSSVRGNHFSYNTASTSASASHKDVVDYGKAESTEEDARGLLLSSCCSSDSSEDPGKSILIPKNMKRKFDGENTTSEQTNVEDEISLRKKNLRDIVARNRLKIGKSTAKIGKKSSMFENGEPVSKEIDC